MTTNTPPTTLEQARTAYETLTPEDKATFISGLPSPAALTGQPSLWVINYVWIAIISAFVLIFLFSGGGLGIAVFQGIKTPDLLVTVFSTSVGFLAGVLTPSPVGSTSNH
jgi:hypothetical protein